MRAVLYQLATNTAIPDDKGERVAGVRGQPGPVAGVRPISGGNRPDTAARSFEAIVFCLSRQVKMLNCPSKRRGATNKD